jgi:hypothetical protein
MLDFLAPPALLLNDIAISVVSPLGLLHI